MGGLNPTFPRYRLRRLGSRRRNVGRPTCRSRNRFRPRKRRRFLERDRKPTERENRAPSKKWKGKAPVQHNRTRRFPDANIATEKRLYYRAEKRLRRASFAKDYELPHDGFVQDRSVGRIDATRLRRFILYAEHCQRRGARIAYGPFARGRDADDRSLLHRDILSVDLILAFA